MRIALALLLLCATPAIARIGDTEALIATRYGQPVELKPGFIERHKIRRYDFHNYAIMVEFVDGKSASEFFSTKDHSAFADAETQVILTASAGPFEQWELTGGNDSVRYRSYKFGKSLTAFRQDRTGDLLLEATWFRNWLTSAKAIADRNALKGF